jgi:hypothetical protein
MKAGVSPVSSVLSVSLVDNEDWGWKKVVVAYCKNIPFTHLETLSESLAAMADSQPTGRMSMVMHVFQAGYGSLSSAYCVQAGCADRESHYPAGSGGFTRAKREEITLLHPICGF